MALEPHQSYKPQAVARVNKTQWTNTSFINRLIVYHAKKAGVFDHRSSNGHQLIENFVYDILQAGDDKFKVPRSNIKGCGGFYENPNHPKTSDCDFNIVLDIPNNYLYFQHECNLKNDTPTKMKRQRYFKGGFTDNIKGDERLANLWKCEQSDCFHSQPTIFCKMAIDARVIQKQFYTSVLKGMCQVFKIQDTNLSSNYCFLKGPAVRLAMHVIDHAAYSLDEYITIDLALAMPLSSSWKICPCLEAIKVDNPRLVPSGDYWRLSFSEIETEIINKSSNNAKLVYFAAKSIRDHVMPDFPTYPIKQAFLHTLPDVEEKFETATVNDGAFLCLADCVLTIVDHMIDATQEGRFGNFHQHDDPVMDKADAEFILGQTFKEYLLNQNDKFEQRWRWMLVFQIFVIGYNICSLSGKIFLHGHKELKNWSTFAVLDVGMSSAMLICVIMFLMTQKYSKRKTPFRKFFGLGILFNLLTPSIITMAAAIVFAMVFFRVFWQEKTWNLLIVSICLSGLALLYCLIVKLLFLYMICSCKHGCQSPYAYECVFMQQLCLRLFCSLAKYEYTLPGRRRRAETFNFNYQEL